MARILIVEDDPYVRDFYSRLFKLGKYDVLILPDGLNAVETAKKEKCELILLDIMMPGENGLEVLKDLKLDEETKNIKVAMLTNLEDDESRHKAYKLGAIGYIIKSEADPKVLLDKVKGFLIN